MQAEIQAPSEAAKSVSLEEISKLFSLPLSDAAHFLGVSTSALKTICYEHGLVRWPYRKFVGGKSIDEIKRDATRRLDNPPSIAGQSISFRWWDGNKTGCFGNKASLSDLRNKAVKQGKAALKLGVYRGHGINKLDRSTLVQIFKSHWEHQY
ncbi:hypothetical protein LIER_25910 [Lithospermum erythrorhizon]|uniref:RWP-RK domain-containing protein n=1 Tax=Lithospermum erythrorhizon TaxID=34254 RepID=A0AAV3R9X3_LITER